MSEPGPKPATIDETLLIDSPSASVSTPATAPASGTLPRLLSGIPAHGTMSLDEHLAVHGPVPVSSRRRRRHAEPPLIEQIEQSGLRGRGGAAFLTATKLRAVADSRKRAVVVVNAAEGEPASLKDRTLMQSLPHLVLDGAQLAARAVGADELIVCVCESAPASLESATQALAERRALSADSARTCVTVVPSRYVAGQEAALVNYLNGGPAIPTFTPPMVFQQGAHRRPTFVANVETLAHIALIARYGPDWFRQLGTPSQPGSALVTLSGAVPHPGVYEIEHGASLASLIDAGGGAVGDPRALLVGGYGGSWIDGRLLRGVSLSDEHLAPHSASLGAGVVLLLSADACPVAETARVTRWLADQSSGQCGPCVHGLDSIASSIAEIAGGLSQAHGPQRIARLASLVRRRGACGHPDGVASFVTSALDVFAPELADHSRHGPCESCARPGEMPLPLHRRTTAPAGRRPLDLSAQHSR